MSIRILGYVVLMMVFLPGAALAQQGSDHSSDTKAEVIPADQDFLFKRTFDERTEPNLPDVKLLAQDPPRTLKERIDRLIEGVTIDVPPEYDHYGYEIRRYMSHILNREIFQNRNRLKQELQNIRNAKIVMAHWSKALNGEIKALEEQIDVADSSSSTRTAFHHNSGTARVFIQEVNTWLEHNEKLLAFLASKNEAEYSFTEEQLNFMMPDDARMFSKLMRIREEARKIVIGKYAPFRMMPY